MRRKADVVLWVMDDCNPWGEPIHCLKKLLRERTQMLMGRRNQGKAMLIKWHGKYVIISTEPEKWLIKYNILISKQSKQTRRRRCMSSIHWRAAIRNVQVTSDLTVKDSVLNFWEQEPDRNIYSHYFYATLMLSSKLIEADKNPSLLILNLGQTKSNVWHLQLLTVPLPPTHTFVVASIFNNVENDLYWGYPQL